MMENLIKNIRNRNIQLSGKSEYLKYLHTDEHRNWWMNTKTEHYSLLCWLTDQFNHTTIYDLGTFRGMSALALSTNATNRVITYDNIDWSSERVGNPGNINFIVGNFFEDQNLYTSPFIMVDIDPHNGIIETEFIKVLNEKKYKGLVFLDDIHLNKEMEFVWDSIKQEKHDLTEFGHYSGSGIVIYE